MLQRAGVLLYRTRKGTSDTQKLEILLAPLLRDKLISVWHDRRILPGQEWDLEIAKNLETADIVLLLVSPDFLASGYAYSREMLRAVKRHESGSATVVPIILRPSDWRSSPLGSLEALPSKGRPVALWADRDEAWLDVLQGLRRLISGQEREAPQRETRQREARQREARQREARQVARLGEAPQREARQREARQREARQREARQREARQREAASARHASARHASARPKMQAEGRPSCRSSRYSHRNGIQSSTTTWYAVHSLNWFNRVGCCSTRPPGCNLARRNESRCAWPARSNWTRNFSSTSGEPANPS